VSMPQKRPQPPEKPREAGRILYETWAAVLGGQFRRIRLPPWPELYPGEQDAFREAAHEVIKKGWEEAAPPPQRGRHQR